MITADMITASTPTNAPAIDVIGTASGVDVVLEDVAIVVTVGSELSHIHQLDKNKYLAKHKDILCKKRKILI